MGHPRRLRLAVVDDNPFVRTPEGIRPRAATFHRFVEAVAGAGPFDRVDYCIPVADLRPDETPSPLGPVDERAVQIVPTAPFRGAAGYLRRFPLMWWRNRRVFDQAIREADLVWIKLPASNALIVAAAARRRGVPVFGYVAGSARAVIAGQGRSGPAGVAARVAAAFYDAVSRSVARSGPVVTVGPDLFTSVIDDADVHETPARMPEHEEGRPWPLVWAGRMAAEKGLEDLFRAVADPALRDLVTLLLVGDGPERAGLQGLAARLGIAERITWAGYVADRTRYFELLRSGELFVLPSRAEGVPKALIEAMAAGVPVIATRTGRSAEILGDGRGLLVESGDPAALAEAVTNSIRDPEARAARRARALAWAADRTRPLMASRLVNWMAAAFPATFAGTQGQGAGAAEGRILPGMPSSPGAG